MLEAMKSNVRVIMFVTKPQRKAHGGEEEVPAWSINTQCTDWEFGRSPQLGKMQEHTYQSQDMKVSSD